MYHVYASRTVVYASTPNIRLFTLKLCKTPMCVAKPRALPTRANRSEAGLQAYRTSILQAKTD
jgi:hypothetical protein